jgi:hypothetical protein
LIHFFIVNFLFWFQASLGLSAIKVDTLQRVQKLLAFFQTVSVQLDLVRGRRIQLLIMALIERFASSGAVAASSELLAAFSPTSLHRSILTMLPNWLHNCTVPVSYPFSSVNSRRAARPTTHQLPSRPVSLVTSWLESNALKEIIH